MIPGCSLILSVHSDPGKKMLLEADTDQDGKIDFAEFIKATNKTFPSQQWNDFQAAMPVKGMREIFNSLDARLPLRNETAAWNHEIRRYHGVRRDFTSTASI